MWYEARSSEKKVHDMMDAARKRAQRRALFLAKRRGDPQQSIQVIGSRCRTYRDDGLYQATQDQQGLYVPFFLFCIALLFFSQSINVIEHIFMILWMKLNELERILEVCESVYEGMVMEVD